MHWMWNFKSGKNRQYENPPQKVIRYRYIIISSHKESKRMWFPYLSLWKLSVSKRQELLMYLHMSLTKNYKMDLHFLSCIFKEVFLYAKATKVVDMNIQYMSSQKSRVNVHIYSRVGPYAKTTRVSNACPHKDSE